MDTFYFSSLWNENAGPVGKLGINVATSHVFIGEEPYIIFGAVEVCGIAANSTCWVNMRSNK